MSRQARWRRIAAALFVLVAVAAAWRYWRGGPPREATLFERLPARQAVHGRIELGAVERSSSVAGTLLDRLLSGAPLGVFGRAVDAVVFSVDQNAVYAVAARGWPEEAVRGYLVSQGADCRQPLDEAPCSFQIEPSGSYLSVSVLSGGELALSNGAAPGAVERLRALPRSESAAALGGAADRAAARGALVWFSVDPPLLGEVMRSPPKGWVNLSLLARALLSAERADFTLLPGPDGGFVLELDARCGNAANADELNSVLSGLNRFGAAAAESQQAPDWARALRSFDAHADSERLEAHWSLDRELVEKLGR